MTAYHQLSCEVSPAGLVFTCDEDGCGRRLVIDRQRGRMVVIDRGDRYALHRGSVGGVTLAAEVYQ
jgi:hypothetical protein